MTVDKETALGARICSCCRILYGALCFTDRYRAMLTFGSRAHGRMYAPSLRSHLLTKMLTQPGESRTTRAIQGHLNDVLGECLVEDLKSLY